MRILALLLILGACTPVQERYFSDQEDAEYREMCEPAGCITMPIPKFLELMQRLKPAPGRGV